MEAEMPKKIFLSHSSLNKDFVRKVFDNMPTFAYFDEASFDTGEHFEKSIQESISRTSVFVFFATKESLASTWCTWERNLALQRYIQEEVSKILVFIIDNETSIADLPELFRNVNIRKKLTASQISDIILDSYFSTTNNNLPYFGRQEQEQRFQRALYEKRSASGIPNLYAIEGLNGIGRRAFIKNKIVFALSNLFRFVAEFDINDGEDLSSLYFKTSSRTVFASVAELKDKLDTLSNHEKHDAIIENLIDLKKKRFLPCLVDNGGMFLDNGKLVPCISQLIDDIINRHPDVFCAIVCRRKIPSQYSSFFIEITIPALSHDDVRGLVTALLAPDDIILSNKEMNLAVQAVDGYPPSAFYFRNEVERYGRDLLLESINRIKDCQLRRLLPYIQSLNLNDTQIKIVKLLTFHSPLTSKIIRTIVGDSTATTCNLFNIIDCSVVECREVEGKTLYSISPPLKEAVTEALGIPTEDDLIDYKNKCKKYISSESGVDLDIFRLLSKIAVLTSDNDLRKETIVLFQDVAEVIKKEYHLENYSYVWQTCKKYFDDVKSNQNLISIYIKALINDGLFGEANELLTDPPCELEGLTDREIFFLRGFLERKKQNYSEAINFYKNAMTLGRNEVSIYRELAICYLHSNDLENAIPAIENAMRKAPDLVVVLDYAIRIYLRANDLAYVESLLQKRKALEGEDFRYWALMSELAIKKKNFNDAKIYIENSLRQNSKSFSTFFIAVIVYINVNDTEKVKSLMGIINDKFKHHSNDILFLQALYCRHLGKFKEAYNILSSQISSDLRSQILKRECLEKLLSDPSLNPETLRKYETERSMLPRSSLFYE